MHRKLPFPAIFAIERNADCSEHVGARESVDAANIRRRSEPPFGAAKVPPDGSLPPRRSDRCPHRAGLRGEAVRTGPKRASARDGSGGPPAQDRPRTCGVGPSQDRREPFGDLGCVRRRFEGSRFGFGRSEGSQGGHQGFRLFCRLATGPGGFGLRGLPIRGSFGFPDLSIRRPTAHEAWESPSIARKRAALKPASAGGRADRERD